MTEEKQNYLPYVLNAIATSHFTGTMSLVEGTVERVLFFHDGWSVHVQSRLQEETLGRILLSEKRITREQYERMLDEMVQTKKQAGAVLIDMGVLNAEEVVSALEYQTFKKLINCFGMRDFNYFLESKPIPAKLHLSRRNLFEIIFIGIRTAYSVDRLLSEFSVDEETTFLAHQLPADRDIRISPLESKILNSIGTGTTLAQLMSTFKQLQLLLSALYALHALSLIEASGAARPTIADRELLDAPREPATIEIPIYVAAPVATASSEQADAAYGQSIEQSGEVEPDTFSDMQRTIRIDMNLASKALASTSEDHLTFLNISPTFDTGEMQAAYKGLIRRYKLKDINNAYKSDRERDMARQLLSRANQAYKVLLDENSRAMYLATLTKQEEVGTEPVSNRILADVEAQKGQRAISSKHYEEAMQLFNRAIQLYHVDPSYHFQLGLAGYLKAINEIPTDQPVPEILRKPLLEAVALNPHYDMPRLYLGHISKRNGDLKRALKEYESALECNPQCKQAASEIRSLKNHPEVAD
jgi:tetratricopeptide (TPR) repeat protein